MQVAPLFDFVPSTASGDMQSSGHHHSTLLEEAEMENTACMAAGHLEVSHSCSCSTYQGRGLHAGIAKELWLQMDRCGYQTLEDKMNSKLVGCELMPVIS